MKTKYCFLISLLLIILLIIPASFAADDDSMTVMAHDNEINGINDYNAGLIDSEEAIEMEGADDNLEANAEAVETDESNSLGITEGEIIDDINSQSSVDIYTEYSDYINLKSEMLTYDFNLSESNTIYVNSSYSGDEELGTQSNPFKTINSAYNYFINDTNYKTNIFLADGTYTVSKRMTINKNLNLIGESTLNTIINGEANG